MHQDGFILVFSDVLYQWIDLMLLQIDLIFLKVYKTNAQA